MDNYQLSFIGRNTNNTWLQHGEIDDWSSDSSYDSTEKIFSSIESNHPDKPYIVRGVIMGLRDQANFNMLQPNIHNMVRLLAKNFIADAPQIDPKLCVDLIQLEPKIPTFFFTEAGISSGNSIWSTVPQALIMLYKEKVYVFEEPDEFFKSIDEICHEYTNPDDAKKLLRAFLQNQVGLCKNTAEFWEKHFS